MPVSQRDAERLVITRARRYIETVAWGPIGAQAALEALDELRKAVRMLEEAEAPARHAAKRHTEGGDW